MSRLKHSTLNREYTHPSISLNYHPRKIFQTSLAYTLRSANEFQIKTPPIWPSSVVLSRRAELECWLWFIDAFTTWDSGEDVVMWLTRDLPSRACCQGVMLQWHWIPGHGLWKSKSYSRLIREFQIAMESNWLLVPSSPHANTIDLLLNAPTNMCKYYKSTASTGMSLQISESNYASIK